MPTTPDSFAAVYLGEVGDIVRSLDPASVEDLALALADVRRRRGRLFVLGVGGGAAHASHAVNDFRKLCGFEAYAPTDNVAELTARTNDEGWETSFDAWLRTSRLSSQDAILVFSVGGGSRAHNVSVNLVRAIELAREVGTASSASSGERTARPRRRPTSASSSMRRPSAARLMSRSSRRSCGTSWCRIPRCSRRPGSGNRSRQPTAVERWRGLPRPGRDRRRVVWDTVDESFEGANLVDDVRLVPGAADAIRRIRSLDYRTVVVSNQPGVAKGKASHEDPREAHRHVVRLLAEQGVAIDDYRYCLHHPDAVEPSLAGACDCRKPKPGMLLEAAADLDIDLARSWMIGDSDVDAEAGRLAGCRTMLVENPRSAHRRPTAAASTTGCGRRAGG